MNIQMGFNRQFRKLGIILSIPATILISMLVIRFINLSGPAAVNAPGALLPNNRIELQSKPQNSISQLTVELEQKQEEERSRHKLISLDFPGDIANPSKSLIHSPAFTKQSGLRNIKNRAHDIGWDTIDNYSDQNNSDLDRSKLLRQQGINTHSSNRLAGQKGRTGFSPVTGTQGATFTTLLTSNGKQNNLIHEINTRSEQKLNGVSTGFNGFSKEENGSNPGVFPEGIIDSHASPGNVSLQIKAFALGDQKIHQGSIVKLRTVSEYSINGRRILQNTIFYAFASFGNDRLMLYVNKIKANSLSFNLHLVCFDDDEKEGIAMITVRNKWAETAETGKNSAVDEVSSRLPVASGMLSQVGHKLFSTSRNEEYLLADGLELSFKQRTD